MPLGIPPRAAASLHCRAPPPRATFVVTDYHGSVIGREVAGGGDGKVGLFGFPLHCRYITNGGIKITLSPRREKQDKARKEKKATAAALDVRSLAGRGTPRS